jgi:hypothetical protein
MDYVHNYRVSRVDVEKILPSITSTEGRLTNINVGGLPRIEAEAVLKHINKKRLNKS